MSEQVTVNADDLRAVLDYFDFAQAKSRRPQPQANSLRAALDPPKGCGAELGQILPDLHDPPGHWASWRRCVLTGDHDWHEDVSGWRWSA